MTRIQITTIAPTEEAATHLGYERPKIETYTSDELLKLVGPVMAGNGSLDACDTIMGGDCTGYYAPEEEEIG